RSRDRDGAAPRADRGAAPAAATAAGRGGAALLRGPFRGRGGGPAGHLAGHGPQPGVQGPGETPRLLPGHRPLRRGGDPMNLEEQIRDELHRSPLPATLVPPPDLADTVLRQVRRGRHARTALISVLAAAAVAFGVPVAVVQWTGGPDPGTVVGDTPGRGDSGSPSEPALAFPTPGGGPNVIHAYTRMDDETTYLQIGR